MTPPRTLDAVREERQPLLPLSHACRGCGEFPCRLGDRDTCERRWRASETTWRLPTDRLFACPLCSGDVRSADACVDGAA